jgi:pantoate--beta-alanine ligase
MQILRESIALCHAVDRWRVAGERIALVPTMGALHAGHIKLLAAAREKAGRVIASIFVNPLQFNDPADLARYPRREAEDLAMLEAADCDAVWLPTAEQFYPDGFATGVHVAGVSERWEGEHRLRHFDGVATVVTKLLAAARPDLAVFGEKDYQQLAVIRRLAADLGLPVEILGAPTVRDDDGLALSSRNALLSADERERAVALPRGLEESRAAISHGRQVATVLAEAHQRLSQAGFSAIDYFALVDSATFEPLDSPRGEMRLIAAATIGTTRLIDNISVEMDTVGG